MAAERIFVGVVFALLGASFLASTGLLIQEFRGLDWQTLVITHAYLFYFFPVLGILALCAFYIPSVIFTHLYWNHLPYGKLRYFIGTLVVAAAAIGFAKYLDKPPRAIWEASAASLIADKGDPANKRAPILETMTDLREKSQRRLGLSAFARPCRPDPLLELPDDMAKQRYCFPAQALLDGTQCCAVQSRFADAVSGLQENPATRSLSTRLDASLFLPLKVFLVLIVVAIGLLLARWRDRLDRDYREYVPRIERGVIVGAFAMLFWPAMDYGYQQTANALFGRLDSGPQLRLSLVIAPWVLVLLFYFLRRLGKQGEMIGQISGVVVASVAILRYEQLNDWVGRLFGAGMSNIMLILQAAILVGGVVALVLLKRTDRTRPG